MKETVTMIDAAGNVTQDPDVAVRINVDKIADDGTLLERAWYTKPSKDESVLHAQPESDDLPQAQESDDDDDGPPS